METEWKSGKKLTQIVLPFEYSFLILTLFLL